VFRGVCVCVYIVIDIFVLRCFAAKWLGTYTYIYIYRYRCACVCVYLKILCNIILPQRGSVSDFAIFQEHYVNDYFTPNLRFKSLPICMFICMHIHIYICIYIYTYINICIYTYMHRSQVGCSLRRSRYVYICIFINIYIYIYIYMYICICIYIYI